MSSLIPELNLYKLCCCFQSSPFSDFYLALSWAGCLSFSTRKVCFMLVMSTITTPALEIYGSNLNLNLGHGAQFLILQCIDAEALLRCTSPEFILNLPGKIFELKYPERWNLLFSALYVSKLESWAFRNKKKNVEITFLAELRLQMEVINSFKAKFLMKCDPCNYMAHLHSNIPFFWWTIFPYFFF